MRSRGSSGRGLSFRGSSLLLSPLPIALILWVFWSLLHIVGGLEWLDRALLDPLHHQRSKFGSSGEPALVVVSIDAPTIARLGPLPWSEQKQESLLLPILIGEAQRVGLAIPPEDFFGSLQDLSPSFLEPLENQELILGRSASVFDTPFWSRDQDGCENMKNEWPGQDTVLLVEPDVDGRVRHHRLGIDSACGPIASLEQALAGVDPSDQSIRLDGRGSAAGVMVIPGLKVIEGDVRPSFFQGRTVLVGELSDQSSIISMPSAPTGWTNSETLLRAQITAALAAGLQPRGKGLLFLLLLFPGTLLLSLTVAERSPMLVSALTTLTVFGMYGLAAAFEWTLGLPTAPAAGFMILISVGLMQRISGEQAVYRRLRQLVAEGGRNELTEPPEALEGADLVVAFQRALSADRVSLGRNNRGGKFIGLGTYMADLGEIEGYDFRLKPDVWRTIRKGGVPRLLKADEWTGNKEVLVLPLIDENGHDLLVVVHVDKPNRLLRRESTRLQSLMESARRPIIEDEQNKSSGLVQKHRGRIDLLLDELDDQFSSMQGSHKQASSALNALPTVQLLADSLGMVRLVTGRQLEAFGQIRSGAVPGSRLADVLISLSSLPENEIHEVLDCCRWRNRTGVLRWSDKGSPWRILSARIHPIRGELSAEDNHFDESPVAQGFPAALDHGFVCIISDVSGEDELEKAASTVVEAMSSQARTHLKVLQWGLELATEFNDGQDDLYTGLKKQVAALRDLFNLFHHSVTPDESTGRRKLPADLVQVVRQVVSPNVLPTEGMHRIELEIPEEVSPVLVDVDTLSTVLRGLVMDSLNNGPRTSRTQVRVQEEAGEVSVEIRDDGYGIPQSVLDHIGDSGTARGAEQNSLAAAAGSVEQAGGQLHIESRMAEGTTYRLVFPKNLATG